MTKYVALLRAVNVGGTGNLPMADLKSICSDAGFARVETYIASGNVIFESKAAPSKVKAELETRFGSPMRASRWEWWCARRGKWRPCSKANPFPRPSPKHTYANFLDHRPARDALDHAVGKVTKRCASAIETFLFIIAAAWGAPSSEFRQPNRVPRAT